VPIRDQAAQERSLDNDYGPDRGPSAPDDLLVHLFMGDPEGDGVEVPDESEVDDGAGGTVLVPNGYAPAAMSNDDWAPAAGGIKSTDPDPVFPAPLEEYPGTVTHWALEDPVTGLWWDSAPLSQPLDVTGPGSPIAVRLAVFYDNNLDDD
jgi:hypothetical protein